MDYIITFIVSNWWLFLILLSALLLLLMMEKKHGITSIIPSELVRMINEDDKKIYLIDIRSEQDYQLGHVTKSINYPYNLNKDLEKKIRSQTNKKIIIICQNGITSKPVTKKIQEQGMVVFNLQGGITSWLDANLPLVKK